MRKTIYLTCLLFPVIVLLAAAKSHLYWQSTPPGVVHIDSNFYYDETEIGNVHWREYMYWTGKIFGTDSKEYESTMPDRSVWSSVDTCLNPYEQFYLNHPAYNYYPVVGISQKQANNFSMWRSDRVMERILVLRNVIIEDTAQNPKTYFSIKKYYEGQYQGLKPDPAFIYYPAYRLQTTKEWRTLTHVVDSIQGKSKHRVRYRTDYIPCAKDNEEPTPTRSIYERNGKGPVYDLRGNVSEWSSEKGVTLGGGWYDKSGVILAQDTFHLDGVNAWTGFRCVCEWKKYSIK